jgi:hypothetical protein
VYKKVEWVSWKTKEVQSIRLESKNVAKFVAILLSDVKPESITITTTT